MKILVATDGSQPSKRAVKFAIKLVGKVTSESNQVTLVNVQEDASLRRSELFVGRPAVVSYLRQLSERDMKAAARLLDTAGIAHDTVFRTGHVAQEILACAKAGKFDLIVIGSKGRSSIADLLVGSAAQRVLTTAKLPVILVK